MQSRDLAQDLWNQIFKGGAQELHLKIHKGFKMVNQKYSELTSFQGQTESTATYRMISSKQNQKQTKNELNNDYTLGK